MCYITDQDVQSAKEAVERSTKLADESHAGVVRVMREIGAWCNDPNCEDEAEPGSLQCATHSPKLRESSKDKPLESMGGQLSWFAWKPLEENDN